MSKDIKLCGCGCGLPVSPGCRFRKGHWSRTKEAKKCFNSPERRTAISKGRKQWRDSLSQEEWEEYCNKLHTPEADLARGTSIKQFHINMTEEERIAYYESLFSPEVRLKKSISAKKYWADMDQVEKEQWGKDVSTRSKEMWASRTSRQRADVSTKISEALTGRSLSQETRDKISRTLKGHHYHDSDSEAVRKWKIWAKTPEGLAALRLGAHKASELTGYTSIEIIMYETLDNLGINYIPQHIIDGRFKVDAYLPDVPLILEAWGTYWHADPRSGEYDRDNIDSLTKGQKDSVHQDIRKEHYFAKAGIPIVSVWGDDLREDPKAAVIEALKPFVDL